MDYLIDKLVLFIIALMIYLPGAESIYMAIPVSIVLLSSALLSYFENSKIKLGIFVLFLVSSLFVPSFMIFLPLISYDIMGLKFKRLWLIAFIPPVLALFDNFSHTSIMILILFFVSYFLMYRTSMLINRTKKYYDLRFLADEVSAGLEEKNKSLKEKQEYEINLATLNERNRIARDIHDNVGHILSRSILQIGALLATSSSEDSTRSLNEIKDTLSEAMDNIRNSVHNLHEESIDLKNEIDKLLEGMDSYSISFEYDMEENPPKHIKYCFILVVKEALSNIIRHSKAKRISVKLREHPGFYQLVIDDDGIIIQIQRDLWEGKPERSPFVMGMGLSNIRERVAALGGNMNIDFEHGFRIFITVPKD